MFGRLPNIGLVRLNGDGSDRAISRTAPPPARFKDRRPENLVMAATGAVRGQLDQYITVAGGYVFREGVWRTVNDRERPAYARVNQLGELRVRHDGRRGGPGCGRPRAFTGSWEEGVLGMAERGGAAHLERHQQFRARRMAALRWERASGRPGL